MIQRCQSIAAVMIGALSLCVLATVARAQEDKEQKEQSQLADALQGVTVSLEQGLSGAEKSGTPISAKFEVDEGKLQLSVYTMKGNQFSEVIVDPKGGHVTKTEAITSGEDLAAAKKQRAAMAKTKESLRTAVERAVKTNSGFRAVSVVPDLEGSTPTAKVTLLQGKTFKSVSETLK